MKTYQDYYDEWINSTESRDLAFNEWLMLLLDRKEREMTEEMRRLNAEWEENLAEVKRQRDAYYDELTRLRQERVELIDKACKAHCGLCDFFACCPYEFEGCPERNEIRKAMEGEQ